MILVLVDVDNLLGDLPAFPAAGQLEPSTLLPTLQRPSRRSCPVVVSMAMNLRTAATFAGWEVVQQLAQGLARRVAPRASEVRHELALCLTIPEAADNALLQLFGHSPGLNEGEIQEIWLFSRDAGLARQLGNALRPLCPPTQQEGGWSWTLPVAIQRTTPSPAVVLGATEALPSVTASINSSARCATVARKQTQCPTDWSVLLETIARNPWLLSQIGVTLHDGSDAREGGSVRGVARLRDRLALRPEVWLECAPEDGVEYGVEGFSRAWDLRVEKPSVREASVGPGALRIEWMEQDQPVGLTLRCQLPAWLVARLGVRLRGTSTGEPRLDESSVLGTFCGKMAEPAVKVRLAAYDDVLQAKVTTGRSCWWWRPPTNPWEVPIPKARFKAPGAHRFLSGSLNDIEAVQGIAPGAVLYLRSPLVAGTQVTLASPLSVGTLGLGINETGRHAVLASRNLPAGPVACAPIQDVTPGRLLRLATQVGISALEAEGIVPLLQELPLLVPLAIPRPTAR
jgi:hypothetical protein